MTQCLISPSLPNTIFCMIVRNRLTWECSNDRRSMKALTTLPGQISIYPADIPSIRRVKTPFEFIALTLAPERILQGLQDVHLKTRMEFRIRHNVDDPQLRGLMNTLLGEAESGNPERPRFLWTSLTLALSIHYVKQYAMERNILSEYRYGLSAHQRRRILDYIEDNLVEELSLETMAKEIGLSKYYFLHLVQTIHREDPISVCTDSAGWNGRK